MNKKEQAILKKRITEYATDKNFDYTDILVYASSLFYDLALVSDDFGHWAVVDDGVSNVPGQDKDGYPAGPYCFSGSVDDPKQWTASPGEALLNYARQEGWLLDE